MKRILLFCLLGLSLAGTAGCDDAENSALSNLLYLAEAEKSDAYGCNTSIIRSGHQIYVTARMSSKLDHPVTVDVDVDEALIDRHNAEFDETLQLLPESNWTFLDDEGSPVQGRHCEITIPAGQSSASVPIRLTAVAAGDLNQYALPLTISGCSEAIPVFSQQKNVLYTFQQDFEIPVFIIKGSHDIVWRWANNDFPATNTWTVEFHFTLNRMTNDQAYGNEMAWINGNPSSLYLRPYAHSDAMDIHLHGSFDAGGFSVEKGLWSDPVNDGRWHHFAYVCNNDKVTSYLDGVEMASVVNPLWQEPTKFDGFNFASPHHPSPIGFSEYRIWTVARSAGDIERYKYSVNPKAKGLFAYYKLNEGEGHVFHDATGNGHDLDESSFNMYDDKAGTKFDDIVNVFSWGKAKNDDTLTSLYTTDGAGLLNTH